MGKLSDSCFFNFTCHRAARRLALTKQFIPLNLLLRFLIKTIFAVKITELQRSTINKTKFTKDKIIIMSSIFNYFELKLFYMRPQYKDVFFRRCVSAKSLWGYTKQLILSEWLTMLLKRAFTREQRRFQQRCAKFFAWVYATQRCAKLSGYATQRCSKLLGYWSRACSHTCQHAGEMTQLTQLFIFLACVNSRLRWATHTVHKASHINSLL